MKFCQKVVLILLGSGLVTVPFQRMAVGQEAAEVNKPTLEQVKATGALRSSYRKQVLQTKDHETPQANLRVFASEIEPALKNSCYGCHGPDTAEGELRLDSLNADLLHGDDVNRWLKVSAAVGNGEMPPKDGPELADADRAKIVEWLSAELQVASQVQRDAEASSSFRRMTRYEYNYAMQDLLGLELDFAKDLPPESVSEGGFKNSSDTLQMTGSQYVTYLELSRKALQRATVRGERPEVLYWGVSAELASADQFAELAAQNESKNASPGANPRSGQRRRQRGSRGGNPAHYKNTETGQTVPASWSWQGAVNAWTPTTKRPKTPEQSGYISVLPAGQQIVVELGNRLPDEGTLRVRLRASRLADETDMPTIALEFGWQGDKDWKASSTISSQDLEIDATAGHWKFYQFDVPLSEIGSRNPARKTIDLPMKQSDRMETSPSEYIRLRNTSSSQSAGIQFDYIEVSAPVYDAWPPASHSAIFFDSRNADDENAYAREIVSNFMKRAWRRSVTDAEVDVQMQLFARVRPVCDDFEQAVIETLAAVLSSPRLLYLVQSDRQKSGDASSLSDFELATRLAMFLWCSMPDDELINVAASGRLSDSNTLVHQTQRMLADPRHERFSERFVRQWLGLESLDFLQIDDDTYPQFDPSLREAMQHEPIEFFEEILRNNSSVLDFLHADYAVVNGRLAEHYGISDVSGHKFQKVSLQPEDNRGGLLTQAGLLAMNSDGKDSNPLKRGVWLLERILNDPPPPPPPTVPEIDLADPEILKMTLKERMEDHRNDTACNSCHAKIDPWGIAFENFDAVGGWRAQLKGKDIDASSRLYNQEELDGVDGVKRYLLISRQDQFTRALVNKMSTFALGRPLTFADRAEVERITAKLRQEGDGLSSLIRLLVTSDLFQMR